MEIEQQSVLDEWRSESPGRTREVAEQLVRTLGDTATLGLVGPLGAGKTTFVQGMIGSLGGDESVVRSPTYTLLQEYPELEKPVVHADLYRTETPSAQRTVGLGEYFGRMLVLVEWAERWTLGWPEDAKTLLFEHRDPSTRVVKLLDRAPDTLDREMDLTPSRAEDGDRESGT